MQVHSFKILALFLDNSCFRPESLRAEPNSDGLQELYLLMHCKALELLSINNATWCQEENTEENFPGSQGMLIKMF
jgi:hypothetical protein